MRTPLTVLIGQLEVALRHERSGEEYRRALTSALGRAVQLGQIVEALLFLGRAEAEAGLPGVEPLDLHRWVAEHLAGRPSAGGDREVVHRAGGPDPLWVRAHPAAPRPVARQPAGQRRQVRQRPGRRSSSRRAATARRRVLAVEDRGPGIAPEDLPHIFEPFYRSAQARRRGVPGVGLGLAVVRRIATACGGSVAVQSEPGQGARFEVRFPLMPTPVEPSDAPAEIDRCPAAGVESKG